MSSDIFDSLEGVHFSGPSGPSGQNGPSIQGWSKIVIYSFLPCALVQVVQDGYPCELICIRFRLSTSGTCFLLKMARGTTNKRRVACRSCSLKFKPGQGLSLHMRRHCRQNSRDTEEKLLFAPGEVGAARSETHQDRVPFDGNPPKVQEAIELLLRWMPGKLIFTGRTRNANKCARILHVWQSFVEDHPSFFVDNFNYKPDGKAGQRGKMFALFRDEILPSAVRFGHVRSDVEAVLSTISDQGRHVKSLTVRSDGLASVRSIEGWEFLGA